MCCGECSDCAGCSSEGRGPGVLDFLLAVSVALATPTEVEGALAEFEAQGMACRVCSKCGWVCPVDYIAKIGEHYRVADGVEVTQEDALLNYVPLVPCEGVFLFVGD